MPTTIPSAKKSTLLTNPSPSLALALIVILAGGSKLAPFAGAVMLTEGGWPVLMLIENMPRPCVAATSVLPIQKSSSTEQLVGPSLLGDQLAPPLALAKTPTSVPTYRKFGFCIPDNYRAYRRCMVDCL